MRTVAVRLRLIALDQEQPMTFTLATWNINSVRLREGLVAKLMADESPDVL